MKLAVPKERWPGEMRVAATPDSVRRLAALGFSVTVEAGVGAEIGFADAEFRNAGAEIAPDYAACVREVEVVLKVRRPLAAGEGDVDEIAPLREGAVVIALFDPWRAEGTIKDLADSGVDALSLELVPRITRAQSMDVLSSQANLAGYRAVIDASAAFGRAFPMMMTAAGTVPAARVMVMGAGVAGLQAIATAKRLGAVVSATDVRPAAKEQVESLGGTFVAVEDEEFKEAEAAGGYAKEMSEGYRKKQAELIAETIKKQDVVITTALIPGRPAPKLITEEMVATMKPGSVIVDLAVEQGGNVALSMPDEVVERGGVKIIGYTNWPSRIAVTASSLFARNMVNLLQILIDKDAEAGEARLKLDFEDQIVKEICLTHGGRIVHPRFGGPAETTAPAGDISSDAEGRS